MGGKKSLFLFLALLLPVLIFLFLKFFGKNEFDVPLPHEERGIDPPVECGISNIHSYRISDSVLIKLPDSELHIISINRSDALVEVIDKFKPLVSSSDLKSFKWSVEQNQLAQKCVFLMTGADNAVLFDKVGLIRGYYDIADRDELDRLEAELKIILKKY